MNDQQRNALVTGMMCDQDLLERMKAEAAERDAEWSKTLAGLERNDRIIKVTVVVLGFATTLLLMFRPVPGVPWWRPIALGLIVWVLIRLPEWYLAKKTKGRRLS